MQLSQINQTYINNVSSTTPQKQTVSRNNSNPLEKTPSKDTFEISNNKKKINKKTLIGVGLAAIGLTAGIIAAVKVGNQNKIKQLITQEYDKLAQEAQEQMQKEGLAYEKPQLLFKNLKKDVDGEYSIAKNTITINSKNLNPKKFYKVQEGGISSSTLDGTKTKQFTYFYQNPTAEAIDKLKLKKGTQAEYMLDMRTTMAHELEHSKQAQLALHTQNAKELFLEKIKEPNPNLKNCSDEEIKKAFSFVFNFKPDENKILKLDTKIISPNMSLKIKEDADIDFNKLIQKDGAYYFTYTPKDLITSFTRNHDENYTDYITNLIETEARKAEYATLLGENFEGIDEQTLKIIKEVKRRNHQNLLQHTLIK